MTDRFDRARRQLLAKMISELTWEELLFPKGHDAYTLTLTSGRIYRFSATRRIWDNLDIDPGSLSIDEGSAPCPLQFTVDARNEFGMSPATEATFLRELSNTLHQDLELDRMYGTLTAKDLIEQPSRSLHAALDGHPKAVANKGRLGWGCDALSAYAPEYHKPIQLFWLAVENGLLRTGRSQEAEEDTVLASAIGSDAAAELHRRSPKSGTYQIIPVHPWQWRNVVQQAFVAELMTGRIVPLGFHGPDFVASPSLRTLTPVNGSPYDVKLSLSILNTSAWRGMPGKYIEHGGAISDWLATTVENDPVLRNTVLVLREALGHWVEHPLMRQSPEAPYRHHEVLGALWRDNADHKVGPGRRAIMAAALFHEGACGRPLLLAHAEASGLSPEDWLKRLFQVTVMPLWHFLCRYGVGFIAHGQNVTVVLDKDVPVGMAIKDFQGDLDLVDHDFPEMAGLDPAIRMLLPRKPPAYIVHDIQTAHFITVLRFLSAGLARAGAVKEQVFYNLLSQVLSDYATEHPDLAERHRMFDLFAPTMPKVCINRVRFDIGYEDSAARPLPTRGTDLSNPLNRCPSPQETKARELPIPPAA
ncbi:IucA/IucC family siderophore biosynthesis protein [Actibacterium sp. 188UL27-1]|uniref:IucA/IucC family protein n=1 Tax=Actibacterium sp. 188UL27-1 TaxID=2786961 RepID=UPI00195C2B09|nr:IucA/IucC family protein [Actibacterium sp. 188UL27-1]MBM7069740.1 hypothetical protein [Actibacterium sp. 188UL27-1]